MTTNNYTTESLLSRTADDAPENDSLIHGRVRLCRSCGCETTRDRICDACAEAFSEERAQALAELCRIYGVKYVEDLPPQVLGSL